jgi:histidinol-phosphate aminotransferase
MRVAERRQIADICDDLYTLMERRRFRFNASEATVLIIDCKRAGREVYTAMLLQKIAIGRSWPSLPTRVRVTIGTGEKMAKFKAAFATVLGA